MLTALLLLIGAGVLGMDAPHVAALWLFLSLAAITVAIGTLVLYAALGSLGQLVAMIFFIYLALASSGGTIAIQAVPGFFRVVGQIEPLRLIVGGMSQPTGSCTGSPPKASPSSTAPRRHNMRTLGSLPR